MGGKRKRKGEGKNNREKNPLRPSAFSREDGDPCGQSSNTLQLTSLNSYSEALDEKLNYKEIIIWRTVHACMHNIFNVYLYIDYLHKIFIYTFKI